jgi:hypothetical protein
MSVCGVVVDEASCEGEVTCLNRGKSPTTERCDLREKCATLRHGDGWVAYRWDSLP